MDYFRKLLAIWLAKLSIFVSRVLGKKGSTMPGRIALKIYPSILKELASGVKKDIVVVCGTNGKTTTNNMLYKLLSLKSKKIVCNLLGANMLEGVTSAFIEASLLDGSFDADYACLEIDEASAVKIFDHLTPSILVITNLFRDQLDRYGELDITIKLLDSAIEKIPNTTLVLNGDDPLTARFGHLKKENCFYFGIGQDVNIGLNETKEGRFCAICGEPLSYNYYHYSQLGDFYCQSCEFKRPNLDFRAHDVDIKDRLIFNITYEGEATYMDIDYKGFYNIYNVLGSITVASLLGIGINVANNILKDFTPQIGRMEEFTIAGKPVILNLSKNPAGFNQAISTVLADDRIKNVMVIINDNAQDGKDISWIWDVDFERLSKADILSFVASGVRKDDLSVRFKYAGLKPFVTEGAIKSGILNLINELNEASGDVCYVLVNYTALFEAQNILKKLEMIK